MGKLKIISFVVKFSSYPALIVKKSLKIPKG